MTKKKRYKRYSPEFKREALKRAAEEGATDVRVCEELGISTRQLHRWRDELRLLGNDAFPGSGRSRDEEMTKLKRQSKNSSLYNKCYKLSFQGYILTTTPKPHPKTYSMSTCIYLRYHTLQKSISIISLCSGHIYRPVDHVLR